MVDQAILRFSRCPTLNPRLRGSAPARPPPALLHAHLRWTSAPPRRPPRPEPPDATPPLSSPTSGLIALAALARHQGRPVGILLHWGIATSNIRPAGDGDNDGPTPTNRQGKEDAVSGHAARSWLQSRLCWPGHGLASPLASHCLDRPLSAGKDALIVKAHHHAGRPPGPGQSWRSCPTVLCLASSPGVVLLNPRVPPRGLLRIPSVYLDSSLRSLTTEALLSLVLRRMFEKLQV